jgi:hypothetical protein
MSDSIISPQDVLGFLAYHYRDKYMSPELAKSIGNVTADLQAETDSQIMAIRRYGMARGME